MLDTNFRFGKYSQYRSEPLEVLLLREVGDFGDLGERFHYEILREDRFGVAEISRGDGIRPFLENPQLGSGGVDIDHSI